MTSPFVVLVLWFVHASLVVLAAMLVRACVAQRFAASRAAIGGIGMACLLVVTALALLPMPSIWPHPDHPSNIAMNVSGRTGEPSDVMRDDRAWTAEDSHSATRSLGEHAVSPAWLQRLGNRLGELRAAADTAPRGWQELFVLFMLCGAGVSAFRLHWALCEVRQLRRTSTLITQDGAVSMTNSLKAVCGCRRPIELRQTDQLSSAATFGFFRPVILLPSGWTDWSHEELAAALAHEVAHISRGDYLQRLLARVIEVVHFYHPLVRACSRCLVIDQEFAADRLASSLRQNEQEYLRGLAKLALRCHHALEGRSAWSSVSVMPKSSDYLARRLEMLRKNHVSTGRRTGWLVSYGAPGSLIAIALAVTLLRVPAASAEKPAVDNANPAGASQPNVPGKADEPTTAQVDKSLFRREPIDVSMIPHAENGAFLIRLGSLLNIPEAQPLVERFNQGLTAALREWTKSPEARIDLRQIEWIAGSLTARVEPPMKKGGEARFLMGSGCVVVRLTQAGKWQDAILKHIAGSSLQRTSHGKSYVQLPVIPVLGPPPGGPRLQFPDDRTLVVYNPFPREIGVDFDLDAIDFNRKPARQPYAWADAWRAVEGGLVTIVLDNSNIGWSKLPPEKKEWPVFAAPLLEKATCYAAGWDWTQKGERMGVQVRGTGADHGNVAQLHLAASMLLNKWPDLFLASDDALIGDYYRRILQFFASVKLEPSPAGGDKHFVHASAEVSLKEQEVIRVLRFIGDN
jgi:beta-lactamase regulating signal transducer with metallopeptidase domain